LVLATVPFLYDKVKMNHHISVAQAVWIGADAKVPDGSLVIIRDSGPYVMHLNPFGINSPNLDGPVLYATDPGSAVFDLIARHPDRTPYMEITSDIGFDDAIHHHDASPPTIAVLPITVRSGPALTFTVKVHNPTGAPSVVASIQAGSRVYQRVLTPDPSGDGTYSTQWTVVPASAAADAPAGAVLLTGRGTISILAGLGNDPSSAASLPQQRENFMYRVHNGEVQVLNPSRRTVIQLQDGLIVQRDVGTLSYLSVGVSAP
jgi:hypothetical protein